MVTTDFDVAVVAESAGVNGQDRATVTSDDDGIVVALADGAGGTGGGELAAQAVIDAVAEDHASADFAALLADLDADPKGLGHGQTTAVVLRVTSEGVLGASVGDSGAWMIAGENIIDLTGGQQRKPLLGSGCTPVAFAGMSPRGATLLVASDGLLRYAKRAALLGLVRLPSGGLQDDVSIVLCRHR